MLKWSIRRQLKEEKEKEKKGQKRNSKDATIKPSHISDYIKHTRLNSQSKAEDRQLAFQKWN